MKQNTNRRWHGGFTLIETLLVVAILAILAGLSVVGVARYKDYLKVMELDDAAREIYMAAENRAVLLQNSGASVVLLSSHGGGSGPVMLSNKATTTGYSEAAELGSLLPTGSIDPALRNGHFLVVYDETSRHVTEVFYSAKDDISSDSHLLDNFRTSRSVRMSNKVGYYAGGAAAEIGTKPMPAPGVEVLIENGDELKLIVRFAMPTLPDGLDPDEVKRTPSVVLKYGDTEIDLLDPKYGGRLVQTGNISSDGTAEYIWVLDSLEDGKQFKDLFDSFGAPDSLGGDFTVDAGLKLEQIVPPGGEKEYIDSAYYAEGKDNSLFGSGTTGDTAEISSVRHLQNLDPEHSKVGDDIKHAEQTADIDCKGKDPTDPYNFKPINNPNLESYDGGGKEIRDLHVETDGPAGLFEEAPGGMTIKDVKLVDPDVKSTDGGPAAPLVAKATEGSGDPLKLENVEVSGGKTEGGIVGGIIGEVEPDAACELDGCQIKADPSDLLETNPDGTKAIKYETSGDYAGGLIGYTDGSVTIKNSYAATTLEAKDGVGGLIGGAGTNVDINIQNSYADCYLNGKETGTHAGGLVGENSGTVKLENTYAAGFITGPAADTAGLVGGPKSGTTGASVTAGHSYSVVRKASDDLNTLSKPSTPLYPGATSEKDDTNGVYYLSTKEDAAAALPHLGGAFEEQTADDTTPYNLRYQVTGNPDHKHEPDDPYPFPGLKIGGNPVHHFCDWAELKGDGIQVVYYELYKGGGYGVCYSEESGLESTLMDNVAVVKDGYALMFKDTEPANCTIKYGNSSTQEWTLEKIGGAWYWTMGTDISSRGSVTPTDNKLFPLPDAIVIGNLPSTEKFYQKLECGGNTVYFNPHFAKTVVKSDTAPTEPNATGAGVVKPNVIVRTARHLYDLSRTYDSDYRYWNKGYSFKQERDLDYKEYTGSLATGVTVGGSVPFRQDPIGGNIRFSGTYDGGCHTIRNVFFNNLDTGYLGLFGTLASGSTLENIVYELDSKNTLEAAVNSGSATGILLGLNEGTVENCAVYGVNIKATASSNTTTTYFGGLVGSNIGTASAKPGTIKNCSAELVSVTASNYPYYVGGLVGRNGGSSNANKGTIENCYAVGSITRTGTSACYTAGLAASGYSTSSSYRYGTITKSYAAVGIETGGTSQYKYGLAYGSYVTSSYWLRDRFRYHDKIYDTTSYTTTSSTYGYAYGFSALKTLSGFTELGAAGIVHYDISDKTWKGDYEGENAKMGYFVGVTDAAGNPVHYGLWPVAKPPIPAGVVYYETYETTAGGKTETEYGAVGYDSNFRKIDTGLPDDSKIYNNRVDGKSAKQLVKDGYALIIEGENAEDCAYTVDYRTRKQNGSDGSSYMTLTLQSMKWTGTNYNDQWDDAKKGTVYEQTVRGIPLTVGEGENAKTYTMIPLPDVVMTTMLYKYTGEHGFYGKIAVNPGSNSPVKTFYFNPHFAATVHTSAPAQPVMAEDDAVRIRTPRHLYGLAAFRQYIEITATDFQYYWFKQELDLDYAVYKGYSTKDSDSTIRIFNSNITDTSPFYQPVIGALWRMNAPKCIYTFDGNCHAIRNVIGHENCAGSSFNIDANDKRPLYCGLFGALGEGGTIQNVVIEMNPACRVWPTSYNNATYYGVLLGYNKGTVKNCAVYGVNLYKSMSTSGVQGAGGLVGGQASTGVIEDCSAELASLEVGYAERVGGLVGYGYGNGTIRRSYAVGKIKFWYGLSSSSYIIAGLSGYSGKFENCYAAVNLENASSYKVTKYGLAPYGTIVEDTASYWVKDFLKYRGEEYVASANDYKGIGTPVTIGELNEMLADVEGLSEADTTVKNFPNAMGDTYYDSVYTGNFPYLTGVKDAAGNPIHYGLWPVKSEKVIPPVGLFYYENYSDGSYAVSGLYRDVKVDNLPTDKTIGDKYIALDGYALTFKLTQKDGSLKKGDIPGSNVPYQITYSKNNETSSTKQHWKLGVPAGLDGDLTDAALTSKLNSADWTWTLTDSSKYSHNNLTSTEQQSSTTVTCSVKGFKISVDGEVYVVIPLPNQIVYKDVVQYDQKVYSYLLMTEPLAGEDESNQNAYWFNPHLAKTVRAEQYTPAEYTNYDAPAPEEYISVRTPRHFYDLSEYGMGSFNSSSSYLYGKWYIKQELDLDFREYRTYQAPISNFITFPTARAGTLSIYKIIPIPLDNCSYDGGGHKIKNVVCYWNDTSSVYNYGGIFRYCYGLLKDINYEMDPAYQASLNVNTYNTRYVGCLLGSGGSNGRIENCTVTGVNMRLYSYDSHNNNVYFGGLVGSCSGKIRNCSVEIASLTADRLNQAGESIYVYAGGLAGNCSGEIVNSAAKIDSLTVKGKSAQAVGGLVGFCGNNGIIENSFAEFASLSVMGTGTGSSYVGGLCGQIGNKAVVRRSFAVGSISLKEDGSGSHFYVGPLTSRAYYSTFNVSAAIENSYAAVRFSNNGCTMELHSNFNNCVGTNVYYLKGSYLDGGTQYEYPMSGEDLFSGNANVEGLTYEELAACTIPGMDKVQDDSGYPFPVSTTDEDGKYYYPGTKWPAAVSSVASAAADVTPEAIALSENAGELMEGGWIPTPPDEAPKAPGIVMAVPTEQPQGVRGCRKKSPRETQ